MKKTAFAALVTLTALYSAQTSLAQTAQPNSAPTPPSSFLDHITVSVMADSIFTFNSNHPDDHLNSARVFDRKDERARLNAAQLTLSKEVSTDDRFGFRVSALAGDDAKVIHSKGLGDHDDQVDLEQAYFEIDLGGGSPSSFMNDVRVKLGKFVTLAGAEVIESKDNWNTSRSFLFGYAIPFAMTGARATYVFDNGWDAVIGVNDGWDVVNDKYDGKNLEAHFGINNLALPGESTLTVAFQGNFGPAQSGEDGSQRNLGDLVATYHTPWKPLTLVYNFDYAHQGDAQDNGDSAHWFGQAMYARLDLAEKWSLSTRAEIFHDPEGARINSGTAATYREVTGTLEYRPLKGIALRAEVRRDLASQAVFTDRSTTASDQTTVSGEILVSY